MELYWLKSLVDAWQSGVRHGRVPHAVMLAGPPGTGKRAMAAWLARQRLGMPAGDLPAYPFDTPAHADLRWLSPPEDKHTIGIDQVRTLVDELNLTSYEGRGKAAVISPADAMTHNAANSLLKTLEEPPGDALLVLVVDRPGRLPATIFSRCQRLNTRVPAEDVGLQWLSSQQPRADWPGILRDAGYAPIAALESLGYIEESAGLASDFRAIAEGRAGPLEVAARWSKQEPDFVLGWLARQVQQCIARAALGLAAGSSAVVGDSVLERIDRRNLFCYLDIINRLRGQPAGSFNVHLTLECLLIDWSERLENVAAGW